MSFRIMSNPANGDVAIYEVPGVGLGDDLPLTDPFGHPNRLQWHTGVPCPSTTDALTQEHTITIPTQAANTKYASDPPIELFAHGLGEACMVEGGFFDPDAPANFIAFNGTMPINVTASGHATWLWLGSTSTHVVCGYFGITRAGFSSFDVTVEASAYDFLVSGWADPYDPDLKIIDGVEGSPTILGRGRINTGRRYLRQTDSGGDFALATGPTLSIIGRGNTQARPPGQTSGSWVQAEVGWRWRYSCAGYVKETTEAWNGSATDGGTYNAPYILVKRR